MLYHQRSYDLLRTEASADSGRARKLLKCERRLRLELPPAVVEWYQRADAIDILKKHSNDDPPVEIGEWEVFPWESQLLLDIRYENQGVCAWAILLDGSADPPVLIDLDTDGEQWNPFADRFSDYVYSNIWDYQKVLGQPAQVLAQNGPLSAETITALREAYEQEVFTRGWAGGGDYRFLGGNHAILIRNDTEQADWYIGAGSAADLQAPLRWLSQLDNVGAEFYSCDKEGEKALKELRSSLG